MSSDKQKNLDNRVVAHPQRVHSAISLGLHLALILLTAWHVAITVSFYQANRFFTQDVANIDYMFYYTWHGRFFWSLVVEAPHFSKHFTPTLVALVPFHALFRHPLFIPILETLAVMSGAWAVAWMVDGLLKARKPASAPDENEPLVVPSSDGQPSRFPVALPMSGLALAIGWLYAANPHVGSILLAFHFESFALALSLWALAALASRKMVFFWILMILAIGVKEDMALYWAVFGAWWILFGWSGNRRHKILQGSAMILICLVWALLAILVIRWTSQASGQPISEYSPRYAWLGNTLSERIIKVFSEPRYLFRPLYNMGYLLLPATLFLPIFAPSTLLLLIPGAYLMGLADVDSQYALYYYYSYPFIPFLFLGVALGIARLIRWNRAWGPHLGKHLPNARTLLKAAPILLTLALFFAGCIFLVQPTRTDHLRRTVLRPTQRHAWIRMILRERLPPQASIAAQFDLLAQVPYRTAIYPLSEKNLDRAEYWVFDLQGFRGDVNATQLRRMLARSQRLIQEGKAEVIIDSQGLLIIRHRP